MRGAAQSVYDKYQQLARDAQTSGDRVLAENYLQHAEHYFRLLRAIQPQRPLAEIIGREQFTSGFDLDFEEEPGAGDGEAQASEASAEAAGDVDARAGDSRGEERWRDDRRRDDRQGGERQGGERPKDERPRDDRPREDRSRDDRSRDDKAREDRYRDDRQRTDRYRDDRPRDPRQDRYRGERPRDDRNRDEWSASAADPLAIVEPRGGAFAPAEPREAPQAAAPILRADDGEVSHAPAFLNLRPQPPPADEGEPEPGVDGEVAERPAGSARPPSRRRRSSAAPTAVEGG